MNSFADIFAFYRDHEAAEHCRPVMVRFLDLFGDLLRSKVLYFTTSHTTLWISKIATYPERQQNPGVGIWSDGRVLYLDYQESWQDGPFFRSRSDRISCELRDSRSALLELLARLKLDARNDTV